MVKAKKLLQLTAVLMVFAIPFVLAGCGGEGASSGGSTLKASTSTPSSGGSLSLNTASSRRVARGTFTGHFDSATQNLTFSMNSSDTSSKLNKRASGRVYTSGVISPTTEVIITNTNVSWDSINNILSGNVTVTNNSSDTLFGIYATITIITDTLGNVNVLNENGYDQNGDPYFDHSPGGEKLVTNATGSAVQWQFHDPDAESFDFEGAVYADNWHAIAGYTSSFTWDNASADDATDTVDNLFVPSLGSYNGKVYAVIGKQDHGNRDERSEEHTSELQSH